MQAADGFVASCVNLGEMEINLVYKANYTA